jgi:hypothetical protein
MKIILILCVIVEFLLVFTLINIQNTIHKELLTGLAILVMLLIIRLITNLTSITYGNNEEN